MKNASGPFDVAVLGGGIAGLTAARALARRGARVALLERDRVGEGASRAAAGMLAPLVEARLAERELLLFGRAALDLHPGYVAELERETGADCGLRTEGTLAVAAERDHLVWLDHFFEEQRALGLEVERLSGYDCRRIEPMLRPGVPGGVFSPRDIQIDNRRLIDALLRSLHGNDRVEIVEGWGTGQVEDTGGEVVLRGEGGRTLRAERCVVATGAWSEPLREISPSLARAIIPVKGQIIRLDSSQLPLLDHIVRTPEMYLVPKGDGTVVLGATSEDRGFDPHVTAGALFELIRAAWEAVPAVLELPVVETRVGYRPATTDHLPVLGVVAGSRVVVAGGYYRHGILFAPLAAETLAAQLVDGTPSPWLDTFSPDRFSTDVSITHHTDHPDRQRNAVDHPGGDSR